MGKNTSKTGRHSAIGTDNYVILSRPAIPLGEMQIAGRILHDPRHIRKLLRHSIPVAIAVPAKRLQIGGVAPHPHESLDFFEPLPTGRSRQSHSGTTQVESNGGADSAFSDAENL